MLEKEAGRFRYMCDDCGEFLWTDEITFHEALVKMKEAGWQARKIDDRWQHQCISCKTEVVK